MFPSSANAQGIRTEDRVFHAEADDLLQEPYLFRRDVQLFGKAAVMQIAQPGLGEGFRQREVLCVFIRFIVEELLRVLACIAVFRTAAQWAFDALMNEHFSRH